MPRVEESKPVRSEGEAGATAVEYGIISGTIALAFVLVGPDLAQAFISILNVVLDAVLGV